MNWWAEYKFDSRGFGDFVLYNGDKIAHSQYCRSGSITKAGKLVNCIDPGTYYMNDESVDTGESSMSVVPGMLGWKKRLWLLGSNNELIFTHLLIHPDGGLGGSDGCIVTIGTNAQEFRHILDRATREQGRVVVRVGMKDGQK